MLRALRCLVPSLVLLLLVFQGYALALTPAELTTLAANIAADGAFTDVPHDTTGAQVVANAYNLNASPNFWVWKIRLVQEDITAQVSTDGTSWSWTDYIARSVGEKSAFQTMFPASGNAVPSVNPSLPNVRAGFADIFSGAPGANQRAHLLAVGRRLASRVEKLFAVGTGSTASPATMSITALGPLSASDVIAAWTQ